MEVKCPWIWIRNRTFVSIIIITALAFWVQENSRIAELRRNSTAKMQVWCVCVSVMESEEAFL